MLYDRKEFHFCQVKTDSSIILILTDVFNLINNILISKATNSSHIDVENDLVSMEVNNHSKNAKHQQ